MFFKQVVKNKLFLMKGSFLQNLINETVSGYSTGTNNNLLSTFNLKLFEKRVFSGRIPSPETAHAFKQQRTQILLKHNMAFIS